MRIDYVPNPPTDLAPEDQEVLERVKARRGAMGLIPLDLTLLHAPKIADGMLKCSLSLSSPCQHRLFQAGMVFWERSEPRIPCPTTFARLPFPDRR